MMDRRHFLAMTAGAAALAIATPAMALDLDTATPTYVRWPADWKGQNWVQQFDDLCYHAVRWRTFAEGEGPQMWALAVAVTMTDIVDHSEAGAREVAAFNRCLENIRRRHGFPVEMIHDACASTPRGLRRPRWKRCRAGTWGRYFDITTPEYGEGLFYASPPLDT